MESVPLLECAGRSRSLATLASVPQEPSAPQQAAAVSDGPSRRSFRWWSRRWMIPLGSEGAA
jgi:hypothetical protein